MERRPFNAAAPLQFVVNGKAGHTSADATRDVIESGLREAGRAGTVLFAGPGDLARVSREGAAKALADGSAVVAVGGDGTINTVAQAAHDTGCTMGALPEGTFNFFAREHGSPTDTAEALRWLLDGRPEPAQISAINDRVFLVNASVGLYPDLLQDRELWKARFGRSQLVAFGAGMATLLRARENLRLSIESNGQAREVRTLTLFVGNNRLQLAKLGLDDTGAHGQPAGGRLTAVILKPIGTISMVGLMLRGALGQLGDAGSIEHFDCQKLVVSPSLAFGRRRMKVAFDGEVSLMSSPLTIRVLPEPLWLLKSPRASADV